MRRARGTRCLLALMLAMGTASALAQEQTLVNPHCIEPPDLSDPASLASFEAPTNIAPEHPEWLEEYEYWQRRIMSAHLGLLRHQAVMEAGVCVCEVRHATYDDHRDEIEAFIAPFGEFTQPEHNNTSELRQRTERVLTALRSERMSILSDVVTLCRDMQ